MGKKRSRNVENYVLDSTRNKSGAICFDAENRKLVLVWDSAFGQWRVPSGRIEEEDDDDALVACRRQVQKETGVLVDEQREWRVQGVIIRFEDETWNGVTLRTWTTYYVFQSPNRWDKNQGDIGIVGVFGIDEAMGMVVEKVAQVLEDLKQMRKKGRFVSLFASAKKTRGRRRAALGASEASEATGAASPGTVQSWLLSDAKKKGGDLIWENG